MLENTPKNERIRVGYIMQKARKHSMFNMMEVLPVFHNKNEIEVFIYYIGMVEPQDSHW